MNKYLLKSFTALFMFLSIFTNAQTSYKKFGIEVNGGLREYHGDLGSSLYFKNSPDYQGVGGAFGMYINSSFDVNLYGSVGDIGFYKTVYDVERVDYSRIGFRSRVTEGMIGLTYKFNNGYILDEDVRFKPYLRAGWGAMSSASKFTPESLPKGNEGYRQDRFWIASHWNAGLGLKIAVSDAIDIVLSEQFNYSFDDNYDASPYVVAGARLNSAAEGNKPLHDIYAYHSLGLVFNFGGDGGSSYRIKDEDGDGISDDFDICPNTPEKYAVDTVGCPMDDDKDGVFNEDDECPDVPGLPAFNGCPDSDGDGIVDSKDKCPKVPGLAEFDGCPDSDGDGITDAEDKCPLKAGTVEGQGCPDSDGDGIYDHVDVCPATPGIVANKGCPEIKEEVKEKIRLAAKGIFFESGKDVLKSESFENLNVLAEILREYKEAKVIIEGHTDSQGDDADNLVLSQSRTESVKKYLTSQGIDESRMSAIGYGESKPVADNATAKGRAFNRRVDFKLVY